MRQDTVRRLVSLALLAVLVAIFGFTTDSFFTPANILTLLRECGVIGIVAVGVTMVIITAGIDLSTGALLGFVAMLSANLLYYGKLPGLVVIPIALVVGALGGYLNGTLVTRLRLPDFIATLSTQFLFRALALILAIRTSTGMISNKTINDRTIQLLGGSVNGVYLVTIAFLVIAVAGQFLLKLTKLGVYTYAVGANLPSAELSGINSARVRRMAYTLTGLLCGVAALFTMGRVGSVTPDLGTGLELNVIAAVIVGGTAFTGGRGDVVGTVIGTVFMMVLTNGIYKYNLPTAAQMIILGSVIIVMVVFDSLYNGFMHRRAVQREKFAAEAVVAS